MYVKESNDDYRLLKIINDECRSLMKMQEQDKYSAKKNPIAVETRTKKKANSREN